MDKEFLYNSLAPKDRNLDEIASFAIEKPELIQFMIDGVWQNNVRVKYGCLNTLVLISKKNPKLLYTYFETFIKYLNSDKKVIKLGAITIIANLTRVDSKNIFDDIFEKYFSFLEDPEMTTAANVSKGSSIIMESKPYLIEQIINKLLKVTKIKYKTEDCKNILIGHIITSFYKSYTQIKNKAAVLEFVKSNTANPWKSTKAKAQKFLQKYD